MKNYENRLKAIQKIANEKTAKVVFLDCKNALQKTAQVLGIDSAGISNFIASVNEEKEHPVVM